MESTNSYKNGIPQFDGTKYVFWSIRMRAYIQAQGFQVWQSIVDGYTTPTIPPTNEKVVKLGENNSKATNSLLNGLRDTVFTKVSHCKSAKNIWDKLQNIYEGDTKVKEAKLQTYRGQFEQLKMKEDEYITAYFLRVDEIVNAIIGLEEEIEESVIVQKILRSLPMRFNPKISALEERSDLDLISMDELHGIFTAYEMRNLRVIHKEIIQGDLVTQRSYNRFEYLSIEVECYKCNNFGHMAKDCRMIVPPKEPQHNNNNHRQEPQKMTWIRNQDQYNNEECTVSLQDKKKKHYWYVDSGCSKHMTDDKDKFLTL
jgi:hypothetical protein